jgi:hypothetical protein
MIKKIFSNAILSIFMDKSAKKSFYAARKSDKNQNKSINMPAAIDTIAPITSAAVAKTLNIKRETLVRNAMAAHKEHSKALDNLSENQKQRLQLLAMNAMFGKSKKSRRANNKNTNILSTTDARVSVGSAAVAQTPKIERETLIRNAMAAHKEHSKALDNLSENQKQRLQLLAMRTMLGK